MELLVKRNVLLCDIAILFIMHRPSALTEYVRTGLVWNIPWKWEKEYAVSVI
jgi:hypothetical protein